MSFFRKPSPEEQYIALCKQVQIDAERIKSQYASIEVYDLLRQIWIQRMQAANLLPFAGDLHASYVVCYPAILEEPDRTLLLAQFIAYHAITGFEQTSLSANFAEAIGTLYQMALVDEAGMNRAFADENPKSYSSYYSDGEPAPFSLLSFKRMMVIYGLKWTPH